MWVRGQTNVPAVLPLAKEAPAHIEYEAGCAPESNMVCTKYNTNFLPLPAIEPLTSDVQLISFTSLLLYIRERGAVQRDYFRYVPGVRSASLS